MALSDGKKRKLDEIISYLFLVDTHNYDNWYENKESAHPTRKSDKEESDIPPWECDEGEVKKGKGLKILTPSKLLTRLLLLVVQIKAGNSSYKTKNEIRLKLSLLYQHNTITKKVCNNLIKPSQKWKKSY